MFLWFACYIINILAIEKSRQKYGVKQLKSIHATQYSNKNFVAFILIWCLRAILLALYLIIVYISVQEELVDWH